VNGTLEMEDGAMRYDRGYGMGMRYGADYQDHWSRLRARPAGMYDREYGYGGSRYDRQFGGGYSAGRARYGSDYRGQGNGGYGDGRRGQRFQSANRFRQGAWSGPYGPLSQRQHWFSPWNDPVPGSGTGMSLPYGMRFGEWL
jgi:hypothetical protein